MGLPAVDVGMDYLRYIFAYFYMPIPSWEELQKITLSHMINDSKNTEVN
jgi:hypothetical protein